ncbi:MAG TPA: 23S rRNA (guanosine(2251)-2'-O)-methyltransferase RlmB [Candidatus Acidoferrales bacterium]|nr:23S rRNA (guanosine(2251)-2'-O)-methyltransferase RlmB [Candidatus Acidoferrales bacterium]
MDRLTGIHAVKEALESGRALERIVIARGRHGDRMEEIVARARERGVPVRFEERSQLDRLAGGSQHQGIVALTSAKQAGSLEDILVASSRSDRPGILVLLDGVEDPHNLGAILRSALAAGAAAVIVPERRAAGLGDTVARAAAGALEHIPVARVVNIARAMEDLKKAGYWLVGLDERAEREVSAVDLTGAIGLVLGGEGGGLHELVRKRCDFLASIPTTGPLRSLNVSVAAGIVLFEAVRQRRAKAR